MCSRDSRKVAPVSTHYGGDNEVCQGSLDMQLDSGCCSRRMGHTSSGSAGTRNPRLVIVKFTMYEKCILAILTTKRKLKGTNIVITENLTRQRVDLLQTAHASLNTCDSAWCGQIHLTSNMQLTASTFSNSHLTECFSLRGCFKIHLTSNMQLTASTFPNSHLAVLFSLVWSCPPNIKCAVDSQYLPKQSLGCIIQPGVVRST